MHYSFSPGAFLYLRIHWGPRPLLFFFEGLFLRSLFQARPDWIWLRSRIEWILFSPLRLHGPIRFTTPLLRLLAEGSEQLAAVP